jgi:hypothetical protein
MSRRMDAHRLLQQACGLPQGDLELLVKSLVEELDRRQMEPEEETIGPSEATGWRQEYRKCGKSTCRCSGTTYRHGPYWYRSVWVAGKAKKEYFSRGG